MDNRKYAIARVKVGATRSFSNTSVIASSFNLCDWLSQLIIPHNKPAVNIATSDDAALQLTSEVSDR